MVLGSQFCERTLGEFDEVMALAKPEELPGFADDENAEHSAGAEVQRMPGGAAGNRRRSRRSGEAAEAGKARGLLRRSKARGSALDLRRRATARLRLGSRAEPWPYFLAAVHANAAVPKDGGVAVEAKTTSG